MDFHERTGTFDVDALHGLARTMPRTAWLLLVAALGSMGLPLMTGFIAEFLVFRAAVETFGLLGLLPVVGVILTGSYTVRMLCRTVFGTNDGRASGDEQGVNPLPFVLLLIASLVLGILPFLLLSLIQASTLT
jgi:NADH-quinone oxidoreductase subunit M